MKKEIPILFSTPMVNAILSGHKTQTRRIIKPQPIIDPDSGYVFDGKRKQPFDIHNWKNPFIDSFSRWTVGDLLWVRENFALTMNIESLSPWPNRPHIMIENGEDGSYQDAYIYAADGEWQWLDENGLETNKSYWKPSIHMPKAVTRIWLEIISIGIQKLLDITEEDAKAEGVKTLHYYPGYDVSDRGKFSGLWSSINGIDSWDENPWVWVIEFKKIERP